MYRLHKSCLALIILLTLLPNSHALSQSLSIDASKPSIHINLGANSPKYMCLSSAEYGQLYLPMKYQCSSCKLSEESKHVIEEGWSPDSILLVIRRNNEFDVRRLNLSFVREFPLYTSYSGAAWHPEQFSGMSQCTRSNLRVASCYQYGGECLFLFEETNQ